MSAETSLLEAIHAIRSGDQDTARALLLELTASEPNNGESWLWLAAVTHDPALKLTHLRQAHALAPNDRRVISGLRALGDIVGDPLPEPKMPRVAKAEHAAAAHPGKAPANPLALPSFAPTGVYSRRPLPWGLIALVCIAMVLMPLAYLFA